MKETKAPLVNLCITCRTEKRVDLCPSFFLYHPAQTTHSTAM